MPKATITVPMNRVEGDLELWVEVDDRVVSDAWCSGTLYRGFEKLMLGRGPLDALVITPRICGICTTSHLTASVHALDAMTQCAPPPNAVRMRNVAQMTEHIQSDMRHAFLMFTADFVNPAYQHQPLFQQAVTRYAPFTGETVVEVIQATKQVLQIIALIGGQWPHSSFMVPGGIASAPSSGDLLQCQLLLKQYREWYERRILGCKLERWMQVQSANDLDVWLHESEAHRAGDLGFFIRFARAIGVDRIGRGPNNFISYGALAFPEDGNADLLRPAGFARGTQVSDFDPQQVAEHVAYSWYVDYEGGRHPLEGETQPYATGREGKKYSWAKAPRYDHLPAETGPLAEMLIAGNLLFTDLVNRQGANVFVRELARIVRPVSLMPTMELWLSQAHDGGPFYVSPETIVEGEGVGLTEAARGALGHWVRIQDGAIQHYQIVTPTAWNASPRDSDGTRGPIEQALVGVEIKNLDDPVELGHVVRSFDPCLVCTVHTVPRGQAVKHSRLGLQ